MAGQGQACRNCATAEVLRERLFKLNDLLVEVEDQLTNEPERCYILGEPGTPEELRALSCVAVRMRSILS